MGHYQSFYGCRAQSNWGLGSEFSDYAEGDIVDIPEWSPAFTGGRIPHSWSSHPELCKPGKYRVISVFSIGEAAEWYYRVAPIVQKKTMWDETSDRLHVHPGICDFTEGWVLIQKAYARGSNEQWTTEYPPRIPYPKHWFKLP